MESRTTSRRLLLLPHGRTAKLFHAARSEASAPSMTFECGARTSSKIKFLCYKYCAPLEPILLQKKLPEPNQLIRYREFILPQSSLKQQACKQLAHVMDEQWSHHSSCSLTFSRAQPSTKKSDMTTQVEDHQPHQPSNLEGDAYLTGLSKKEIERRRKIGAGNKGKVPWTKGRKLSKEHKQLIKQRTIEALKDPKVRKKMLGHRQLHRQVSKDKISAALRKIWERRIVSVNSRQKVLRIWSNSIAEAAKEGDHNQDKLDWDSYDKIKSEMICMFLWNKERERIIKKLKKAVAKMVAKKLQAAERRKLQSRGTKIQSRGTKIQAGGTKKSKPEKLVLQKSDAQPTQVVVSTRPKLKERITKWHERKKDLETVINLRTRQGGGLRNPAVKRRTAERRAEVDELEVPSADRLKGIHLSCKDGLPCADT